MVNYTCKLFNRSLSSFWQKTFSACLWVGFRGFLIPRRGLLKKSMVHSDGQETLIRSHGTDVA
jgi:hypothetical protein